MSISIRDGLKKKDSYILDREINDEKNIAIILDDIQKQKKLDKFKRLKNYIQQKLKFKKKAKVERDKNERETWSGKFDFFLSALGYAVGLGAVWRFPYLCYRNGGGVFLIPYFIFMVFVGIPLVYLELVVGQFTSTGPLTCWSMVPIFRGIGLSMNIANAYLIIYYNMIIAYSLYFLVLSLTSKLPWENCNPIWSSPNCVDDYSPGKFFYTKCEDTNNTLKCSDTVNFGRCFNITTINGTLASCGLNRTELNQVGFWKTQFPSQDYWTKVILQRSDSIEESGTIVWQLIVALFVAWLVVYLMVVRGIKVSGKLVYFTSLFPYVVLLILGIRGWMLPGADIGINFYIKPDISKLTDIRVWTDAAAQIFFTLSVSYGGLVALSSYNRDAIVVSLSNCLTSVFAGFVVFAYLGYLSKTTGQEISEIIQAGQGLAYVVYPYAVTTIQGAPFWAILFFVMMIVLGLDTMMASVETTITSVLDVFPKLKLKKRRKVIAITAICFFYFVSGILFCLQSGTYWIEIFNSYAGDWAVLLVGALECISISWFYGVKNFRKDIKVMIGSKYTDNFTYYIWCACWWVISPGLLVVLVALGFKDLKKITLPDYVFPDWTHILGSLMTASILAGWVFWAIYQIFDALFIHKKVVLSLFKPDFETFKPQKLEHQIQIARARNPNSFTEDNISINKEYRF